MGTNILKLLENRKASRSFFSEPLPTKIIYELKQAAQLSASCFNNQPWRFLFLFEEAALEKGRKALSQGNSWARTAPLLVIGFSKPELDCQLSEGRNYYLFDLGMAVQNILLQATENDLIARPMAGFKPQIIKEEFDIPPDYEIVVMIAIGKEVDISELDEKQKAKSLSVRQRNPLSENFFDNRFK